MPTCNHEPSLYGSPAHALSMLVQVWLDEAVARDAVGCKWGCRLSRLPGLPPLRCAVTG